MLSESLYPLVGFLSCYYLPVSYSSPSLKVADFHLAWSEKAKASVGPQINQTPLGAGEGMKGSSRNPMYTALVLIYPKSDRLIKGLLNQLSGLGLVWEWSTRLCSFNRYFS